MSKTSQRLSPRWLIPVVTIFFSHLSTEASAKKTIQQRAADLEGYIELALPESFREPVPLAVLLPGCLSWHPHHERWKDALLARGYAVLHVDSFAERGLADQGTLKRLVCSGAQLHGDERSGDLMVVLETLRERTDIDLTRKVIFGWSHGGWAALDFLTRITTGILPPNLSQLPHLDDMKFLAAFIFYPYCGPASLDSRSGFPTQTRTLLFHGSRDVITDPRECRRRVKALSRTGATIEFISMEGSHHWFDNHAESTTFDAQATARAYVEIEAVLKTLERASAEP